MNVCLCVCVCVIVTCTATGNTQDTGCMSVSVCVFLWQSIATQIIAVERKQSVSNRMSNKCDMCEPESQINGKYSRHLTRPRGALFIAIHGR